MDHYEDRFLSTTFQSLINISFPKIVGERGEGGKKFSGHNIFTNFQINVP
jgi:hypothetical protein